jgi:hypothetical protein
MTKASIFLMLAGVSAVLAGCGAAGEGSVDDETPIEGKPGELDLGSATQELSSGTVVASRIYWVRRTHIETMLLNASDVLDWYTTVESGNRDPVMTLIQYEPGVADPNQGCSVSPSAQAKFKIMAYDHDGNGNGQPRLGYTVPSSGCYALIVYANSQNDYSPMTTAVLHKDTYKWKSVCQFGWCQWKKVLLSATTQSVPVTGVPARPPAFDFMVTKNPKKGADPWVFLFNYWTMTGASNDDTGGIGGSVNSTIDRTDFQFEGADYNAVALLTGYNSIEVAPNTPMPDGPMVEWWSYKRN